MRLVLNAMYWLIVGGMLGVGIIAMLSIGVFLLLTALPLFLLGVLRIGVREIWAGVVGFGLAPMLILVIDLQGPIAPASTAQTYLIMAIAFGVVAALGVVVGIVTETLIATRHSRLRQGYAV
jgi:hypothetical protein